MMSNMTICRPVHEISVLIESLGSDGSSTSVHMCRLPRAFDARIYTVLM